MMMHLLGIRRVINCTTSRSMARSTGHKINTSDDLAKERYENRANEDDEIKRARLLYQSKKRGMLENGVILSSFATRYLKELNANELDQYDRLINLPTNDWDIYYWATKTKPTPAEFETPIMTKLREHIHCKVSNSESEIVDISKERYQPKTSYYGKSDHDQVVLKQKRTEIDLDPDYSQVSLVDYADELFDYSLIQKGNKYIARMTKWRREYFLKRLRRTISSPVSLRNLCDDDKRVIYGQLLKNVDVGKEELIAADLCDTVYDRNMKHHQFLQYLMGSSFTQDPLEYDDEAKAWAEMIWHRNYGTGDPSIRVQTISDVCKNCNEKLHCSQPGFAGYLPKELLAKLKLQKERNDPDIDLVCQRCRFHRSYSTSLSLDVNQDDFIHAMKHISQIKNSVAIILVDLTDFPSGIYEGLIDLLGRNYHQRILVVGNKIDMLPYDGPGMVKRVTESLRSNISRLRVDDSNLHLFDTMVMSAKTGFNVNGLVSKLCRFSEDAMNMFLIGTANSGKSTLFNSLLQSDLSIAREGDLLTRVSTYEIPVGSQTRMLKFPIKTFEGWEIALKEKKYERIERNYRQIERSLFRCTEIRQKDMPHQSMLINHLDYPKLNGANQKLEFGTTNSDIEHELMTRGDNVLSELGDTVVNQSIAQIPKFSDDHPLKMIAQNEPLSAQTLPEVNVTGFFHHTPSTTTPDQIHDLLTLEEKCIVFPGCTIIPRKYSLRPLQTVLIGGLGRLDLLTATEFIIVTIFASKYLPIHVTETKKADQFYHTFLGTPYLGAPFGNQNRLQKWPGLRPGKEDYHIKSNTWFQGQADIVLSSLGWAMISFNPDQECIIRAHTPEGRGVSKRSQPLLPYIRSRLKQKKIRDTPLFNSDTYETSRITMNN